MHYAGEIQQLPSRVRPERIYTADDLAYWLGPISEEIKQREASDGETSAIAFAHAVLETALQRLLPAGFTELIIDLRIARHSYA